MAQLKYNLVQKGQPKMAGISEQEYSAFILRRNQATIRELSEEIADGRALTPTDVMTVLISLTRKIPNHLLNGDIVKLGSLGNSNLTIPSEGSAAEKDLSVSNIKSVKILYRPSADIK